MKKTFMFLCSIGCVTILAFQFAFCSMWILSQTKRDPHSLQHKTRQPHEISLDRISANHPDTIISTKRWNDFTIHDIGLSPDKEPPLYQIDAYYPESLRTAGIEGTVFIGAVIDRFGFVQKTEIQKSVNPILDSCALAAAKQWRFSTLMIGGTASPFPASIPFSFFSYRKEHRNVTF